MFFDLFSHPYPRVCPVSVVVVFPLWPFYTFCLDSLFIICLCLYVLVCVSVVNSCFIVIASCAVCVEFNSPCSCCVFLCSVHPHHKIVCFLALCFLFAPLSQSWVQVLSLQSCTAVQILSCCWSVTLSILACVLANVVCRVASATQLMLITNWIWMYGMKMIVKNPFLRKCCQAPKLYKKWTENQAISNRFDGVINPDGIID